MKYGIVSDLHLEFWDTATGLAMVSKLNKCDADVLLLAGDIATGFVLREYFLSLLNKPYVMVKGNHDYYNEQIDSDFKRDGAVVAATGWTNFRGNDDIGLHAEAYINDFKLINNGNDKIKYQEMMRLFKEQTDFISLNRDAPVVMTHFPLHIGALAMKYVYSSLNEYFINDLPIEFFEGRKLVVSGHTHVHHDYTIDGVRFVNNAFGYPNENYRSPKDYEVLIIDV